LLDVWRSSCWTEASTEGFRHSPRGPRTSSGNEPRRSTKPRSQSSVRGRLRDDPDRGLPAPTLPASDRVVPVYLGPNDGMVAWTTRPCRPGNRRGGPRRRAHGPDEPIPLGPLEASPAQALIDAIVMAVGKPGSNRLPDKGGDRNGDTASYSS